MDAGQEAALAGRELVLDRDQRLAGALGAAFADVQLGEAQRRVDPSGPRLASNRRGAEGAIRRIPASPLSTGSAGYHREMARTEPLYHDPDATRRVSGLPRERHLQERPHHGPARWAFCSPGTDKPRKSSGGLGVLFIEEQVSLDQSVLIGEIQPRSINEPHCPVQPPHPCINGFVQDHLDSGRVGNIQGDIKRTGDMDPVAVCRPRSAQRLAAGDCTPLRRDQEHLNIRGQHWLKCAPQAHVSLWSDAAVFVQLTSRTRRSVVLDPDDVPLIFSSEANDARL